MKANHKIAALREIAVKAIAFGLSAVIGIGIGFAAAQNKDSRENQPLMHIHNLYADEDGETHFRDIKVEPATEGPGGEVSGRFPATRLSKVGFAQIAPAAMWAP